MPRTSKDDRAARAVRWLHLSDLHFRVGQTWDQRTTLTALIRKLAELRDKGLSPDLIFVTGDIAWSGKKDEYEQAERFFAQVMEVTEVPRERWFVVPGNHDVDRSLIGPFEKPILDSLKSAGDVEKLLENKPTLNLLASRLSEFYAFTFRFLGPARGWLPDKPWRVDSPEVNGVSVGVVQMNSTWAGGTDDDDRDRLIVGQAQVRDALTAVDDTHVRVALLHHPLVALREFDRESIDGLLASKTGTHFLLRGHLHKSKSLQTISPDGDYFEISAGALYSTDTYPRAFNLVDLDLTAGRGDLHLFRYSDEGVGFWAADTQTYEKVANGIARLKLPKKLKIADGSGRAELSEAKQKDTASRYRRGSAAYHGQARFVGFAQARERPNAQIEELFIPLSFSVRGSADTWTTEDLARQLFVRGDAAARVVVLGDPGSGKTTLTRFFTGVAAGTVRVEGVEVRGTPLPIRVAFRDYVQQTKGRADLSLVDYIEQQSRAELFVPLTRGFLERALQRGDAVVMFDGLDEVGTAPDRITMRDRLAAFCNAYPRVPMLLTSRIAGYDDAPLGTAAPADAPALFAHVTITPFTNDQLTAFVHRWYGLQERNDPIARDKGIADLLAALEAAARVKELARNPLLATLVAMIHRFEANLPGDRAKLYELCIRTMLETWPAARGRRFSEIDEGLQRAYLEELAWTMQIDRTDREKNVVIDRATLTRRMEKILRARDYTQHPPEVVSRLVERWIEYLAEGTGILVAQSAGAFGFFHLSFLEYLAARALERHLDKQTLGHAIAQQLKNPMWSEVCLLAVGWHASDAAVLDDLMEHVALETPSGTMFLLTCLREEARFTGPQRDLILHAAARLALAGFPAFEPLREIVRFSARNGRAVHDWLDGQLSSARGPLLRAVSVIAAPDRVQYVISQRADAAECTADLLPLWLLAVGRWAAEHVSPAAALRFLDHESTYGSLPLRSLTALRSGGPMIAALVTLQLASRAMLAAAVPADPAAGARVGRRTVPLKHHLPSRRDVSGRNAEALGRLTEKLVITYEFATAAQLELTSAAELLRNASLALLDGRRGSEGFDAIANQLSRFFMQRLAPRSTSFALSADWAGEFPSPVHRGSHRQRTEDSHLLLAAEAYAGLLIARPKLRREIRIGYANTRLQHRYVNGRWAALQTGVPGELTPHRLAIYLALGWTAATTTWQWPGTDDWIETMKHEPEHWLPRSQWHLCWLTYDPDDVPHRQALEDALKDGDRDPELPGFAMKMREILGNDKPRKPKAAAKSGATSPAP